MTLPSDVRTIPWRAPWVAAPGDAFVARLQQEVGPQHVLYGRAAIAVGRRLDSDDVLFYLPDGPAPLAVVHLTFTTRLPEPDSRFPFTTLYTSVPEWIDRCLMRDAAETAPP